jgi:hypothetical protein
MDIKNLELTENDFKMLVDGLDALPERGMAADIMGSLLEGMLGEKNPEAIAKMKREREDKKRMEDQKKDALKEDVKILQGKLLMFKRWLIENNALTQVNEMIHPNNLR